ncbi:MAG: glycosyl transferase family 2, partial [Clostridiales bacterium]|nr:glycosyl transferase family 2 [Clostridiales bacterium]
MSSYKICVYAISKNEEQFVDRWMDSVGEADLVVVADTGSTDGTIEKLRERGAVVYEENISPWRFDAARNASLGHVPKDMDICVSNDLDEIFDPGWRSELESAWEPRFTRARYSFVCEHDSNGAPSKIFPMEKIHRRREFRWVHPVHEVLEYSGADEDKTVWVNGILLHHYPDRSKPRNQYLPLLELSARENPLCDRVIFWLGREYMFCGKRDLCIETLKNHLSLPTAKWAEEKSASMRFIARCYEEKENLEKARAWLFRSIAECPHAREPHLALAKLGYKEKNWPMT